MKKYSMWGWTYLTSAQLSYTLMITAMPPSELYPGVLSASTMSLYCVSFITQGTHTSPNSVSSSLSCLRWRLGDCLIGLAFSLCFLGALNGCITCLFILVSYFPRFKRTVDKTRTTIDTFNDTLNDTLRSWHSVFLCLFACLPAVCILSALSLFFTSSNAQGPGGGCWHWKRGRKREGWGRMKCLKVGGRTDGRKRKEWTLRGGQKLWIRC